MILCKLEQQQSFLRKANSKILYAKRFVANRMYASWVQLLTDLLVLRESGWKARCMAELALMEDLLPYLQKPAGEREISGLNAYE